MFLNVVVQMFSLLSPVFVFSEGEDCFKKFYIHSNFSDFDELCSNYEYVFIVGHVDYVKGLINFDNWEILSEAINYIKIKPKMAKKVKLGENKKEVENNDEEN